MKVPPEVLKNLLPQSIALSGPQRAMIGCTITFHRKNIGSWSIRMSNAKVYQKAYRAYLMIDKIAHLADFFPDIRFKGSVRSIACYNFIFDLAGFGEVQKALKNSGLKRPGFSGGSLV